MSKKIQINSTEDVNNLLDNITNSDFSEDFIFNNQKLRNDALTGLGIDIIEFEKKYYYYNDKTRLYVSESEHGYIRISNRGLVADKEMIFTGEIDNKYIRPCISQYRLMQILLNKMIEESNKEEIYDIDGIGNVFFNEIAPTFFHNHVFMFELFAKTYLSINKVQFERIHKLKKLYNLMVNTIFSKKQNNSLFHLWIMPNYKHLVQYIENIPGEFKEAVIKYDANEGDSTVLIYNYYDLISYNDLLQMMGDILFMFATDKEKTYYLDNKDIYNKRLSNIKDSNERKTETEKLKFLIDKDLNYI